MTPDQQQQLERVCLALLDAPVADRSRMLDELCHGDPIVRREAEALLAGRDAAGVLLRTPVPGAALGMLQAAGRSSLVGRTLGPYRIEASLGAGGMGQVYRAHDTKLGRAVALKVLTPDVAADPDRLSRFEREARLLAGLSHPAILTVHDVGVHDGVPYVVTELLEGATLREVLTRHQPTWRQALGIALQAVQGLASAHRRGIVHRDLKPENVFLTSDGRVKILDFGLAKRVLAAPPIGDRPVDTATQPGLLVGTVSYMAPEHFSGQPVDARADVFAFGIVLYELLTRRHPFRKDTPAATLDAVLHESPPPPITLVPELPSGFSGIVERCLAKARDDRYPDAAVLAQALIAVAEASPEAADLGERLLRELAVANVRPGGAESPKGDTPDGQPGPLTAPDAIAAVSAESQQPFVRVRRWMWMAAACAAAAASGAGGALWWHRAEVPAPVVRSELSVTPAETLNAGGFPGVPTTTPGGTRTALRWTPDGNALVFVGRRGEVQQLFVRRLDAGEAQPLAGTEGASVPAVSGDGQWVAFWAQGVLKKISVRGGPVVHLERLDVPPTSLVWDHQGGLLFAVSHDAIRRVGVPTPLTTLADNERSHIVSERLPDGRTVLLTVRQRTFTWGDEVVEALDLPTGKRTRLLRDATDARYVPTGHLIFLRRNVLFAAPFDLGRVEVTGPESPILQGVAQAVSGGLSGDMTGAGQFDIASSGALAWIPGDSGRPAERAIVTVDASGRVSPWTSPIRDYTWLRVSPDGRQAAVTVLTNTERGLWLVDMERGALTPLLQRGETATPIWSFDGRHVAFHWLEGGRYLLARQAADLNAQPEVMAEGWVYPESVGPDGELIGTSGTDATWDVGVVRAGGGERAIEPLIASPAMEGWPEASPDGQWLAYASNASGRYEVFVRPYPLRGPPIVVSLDGGISPAWHPGGDQLFYVEGAYEAQAKGRMMVADFTAGAPPRVGRPRPLFEFDPTKLRFVCRPMRCYDVARDGQRFYAIHTPAPPATPTVTHVSLVQNWFQELRARVPARR